MFLSVMTNYRLNTSLEGMIVSIVSLIEINVLLGCDYNHIILGGHTRLKTSVLKWRLVGQSKRGAWFQGWSFLFCLKPYVFNSDPRPCNAVM